MMRYTNIRSLPVIAIAAILWPATAVFAEDAKQDFTLVNDTGYELSKVFVSPSKSDDWEDDVLGQDTLAESSSVDIKFHRAEKTCHWDLKVVYSVDNSSAVWGNIDLCNVEKISIKYNKATDTTSASFD